MKRNKSLIAAFTFILFLIILSGCPMALQTYSITFDTDGGSTVNSQSVLKNEKSIRPATDPTKVGYVFDDWYPDITICTAWNFDTPITKDTILYAKWRASTYTYTVTFDTDGGSTVNSQSVLKNEKSIRPTTDPTNAGYVFDNWYPDITICTAWNFDTPITKDTTLYAKWNLAPVSLSKLRTMIINGDDVTAVNTSLITDMSELFKDNAIFNQDISGWDVSSVTNMCNMFNSALAFNQNISNWDVSNVTNMDGMFCRAPLFNGDISGWDVSSVTDMCMMFSSAIVFNGDISLWNVSSVENMCNMFWQASAFNQDISLWNVSSVTDMRGMFWEASFFNQNILNWDVSNVMDMGSMFCRASSFNGNISLWDVSSVTGMSWMFSQASAFNGDISGWNVSSVEDMYNMFADASTFNQNISSWNVSSVTSYTDFSSGDCPLTTINHPNSSWNY